MAKTDVAKQTSKLYALLKDASPEERQTIIAATLTLFREVLPTTAVSSITNAGAGTPASPTAVSGQGSIRAFFDSKDPQNKLEQLAVAARHRELNGATSNGRDEFKAAFLAAKRPFDKNNFNRDMGNAKTAKFFNLGSENVLSYYGEQYVDALPDREKAAAIKRPGSVKKKRGDKKATAKKG
jgi:hypothetical protein